MAIRVKTQNPRKLLSLLNATINNGNIQTWLLDSDGDYTISRQQWFQRAWMRPYVESDAIIFGIIQSFNCPITRQLYGVYHGRLVATLLSHFDNMIDDIEVTSLMLEQYDMAQNE